MDPKSLGDKIREHRLERSISLRQLATQVKCSPPFLSDIELGRRFPSDKVLEKIAHALDVNFDELKEYDSREALTRLKRLADRDPQWAYALRTQSNQIADGKLTAKSLLDKLSEREDDRR